MSRESGKTWVQRNPERHRAYQKAFRLANRDKALAYGLKYRRAAKIDAIRHYSNGSMCCACCGEAEIDFLNIDHMNGGGTQERKRQGRGGNSFAIYLRKRGFPSGYRILCYNCNCALAHFKICPHERTKNVAIV